MDPSYEERREHTRYQIDNSVSVSSQGIFQITDISRGGFCFKCPPYTPVNGSWQTDILTSTAVLEGFPAERVWVSMTDDTTHDYLPTVVGAKFGALSPQQHALLLQVLNELEKPPTPPH